SSCAAIAAYDAGHASSSSATTAPAAATSARVAVAAPATARPARPIAPLPKRTPSREVLLRLHGSNTIGSELAPRLAEAFLLSLGAGNVHIGEADASHRIWITGELGPRRVAIEVWAPGSKVGFSSLSAGRCDIALASRAIEPAEERAPTAEHILALDGVAVIVHRSNPLGSLTLRQVAGIFSGAITDWAQVDGTPGPIQIYARDKKSGTYDTFLQAVMRGREIHWMGAGAYEDSTALAQAVAGDARGIGFVGLPYARDARAIALTDGDALPIYPTVFTVATEDYPLARRLRLYTAVQPKNPMVARFVALARSDAGQRLVEASGFVPLTVRAQAYRAPREAPRRYLEATRGAERLSVNFRFKRGSAQLDGKARQDIDGVVKFLSNAPASARRMMLFGFADKSGKEAVNRALSKQRAGAVATELREHGVVLDTVDGFGSALPLAGDDGDDARERNRRVEVWVH
ncbi:MAG TPA: phosphate ABC transporter substrate-binding/OmpA family protein, partial [Polyangia bacterium]